MRERDLEQVMRDFYQQRFNVLLCTTIIETGIDVPTANTIIINRADRFGLAQLHQLRGRVGRSHHQAYAYLLVPTPKALTAQAKKRLEAIQAMEELGAGFYLAMHDLEIRGAGEVLGESQSGEMQEIGFPLYTDMLNAAVASLKSGKEPDMAHPLGVTTEINLHCPGAAARRLLRRRPPAAGALQAPGQLQHAGRPRRDAPGTDRPLRPAAGTRASAARLPPPAHRSPSRSASARWMRRAEAIQIQFVPNPPIDPMKIITLIQSKRHVKMAGQDKLRIELKYGDIAQRVLAIKNFFNELA